MSARDKCLKFQLILQLPVPIMTSVVKQRNELKKQKSDKGRRRRQKKDKDQRQKSKAIFLCISHPSSKSLKFLDINIFCVYVCVYIALHCKSVFRRMCSFFVASSKLLETKKRVAIESRNGENAMSKRNSHEPLPSPPSKRNAIKLVLSLFCT